MSHRFWTTRRSPAAARRGTVMVLVLVCLLVIVSLVGTMLQAAVRARRQLDTERNGRQAELLLDAGVARVASRLATEADYPGDTWQTPAADTLASGQVTAQLHDTSGAVRTFRIAAEYPAGHPRSVRRTRTLRFTLSAPRDQE